MKFPKNVRVRKRPEYLRFFHQSDVKRLDNCVIFRIPNSLTYARLGVTVKSKTTSVLRNRIKRQIREHFRLHQSSFKPSDYNIVVPGQVRVTYRTPRLVRQNLEKLLIP